MRCELGALVTQKRGGATSDLKQRFDLLMRREVEDPQSYHDANRDLYAFAKDALARLAAYETQVEGLTREVEALRYTTSDSKLPR